ncbi:dTDP-4-dehydrorhamnose reductase [Thiohalomonas denitrificans]|uniref:dTDP-4-dehydrorhamnose reductase n=1 Tax=Thiohalomonas denitrificans TaxID=415747 RepID=A0A1G5R0F6_9GAMM|nr:dTDP-4-dehydrorhamnose reductase [Thiohalomonas denitrificans]SCZ67328.1 dTDP-4-dehydrorhamnose reductase [Thiohalomonas denitrificans]
MKLLLLGANGQVGWELQRALAPLGELIALGRKGQNGLCGDLERLDELRETVRAVRPDIIVNAAAYTAVDQAESEPERVEQINAEAPGVLAEEALQQGALLVHYSTDYVFDGSGNTPWREDDKPAPLNVYGASKWRGEQAIRNTGARHLIFRTQWVYAARGKNFIRTMLRLAAERDALKVIDDQTGAPTGAELIADTTAHAIRKAVHQPELAGTYNLTAAGETSWHGYARFLIEAARQKGWPLKVADEAIAPVTTDAFPTAARRPHNSRLSLEKLETAFDLTMPHWRHGVERVVDEMGMGTGSG